MRRSRVVLLAVGVAAVAIAMAGWMVAAGGDNAPPGPPAADVYAGVAAALTRPGMVTHVTFDTGERGDGWISSRREAWLDVENDAARERTTWTYRSPSVTTTRETGVVYRAGSMYGVREDGQAYEGAIERCPDAAVAVLALLANCSRAPGTLTTRTESRRRFDGMDAIAVVIEGKLSGIDSVVEVHNRLYVDAERYLPMAFESKGVDRYGIGYENDFRRVTRYAIEFVARESLPAWFFEPGAVGYPSDKTPQPVVP